ncbi:hypothetical protein [Streptomyces angustmyceticus]|uniref:hypothetical protein n=1 Tax=Streptomyces angustmyceticus TaxID=285578 RepID=UPI0038293080
MLDQPALQLGVPLALGQSPAGPEPFGQIEGFHPGAGQGGVVAPLGAGHLLVPAGGAGRAGEPVSEERIRGLLAVTGAAGGDLPAVGGQSVAQCLGQDHRLRDDRPAWVVGLGDRGLALAALRQIDLPV